MHIDWSFIENFSDADNACLDFYFKLEELFSISVLFCPGLHGTIIRDIRSKGKFHAKYKTTSNLEYLKQFQNVRKKLN